MNTSTLKVRTLLILLFISVMPFTYAQGETEYLGIIAAEGPKDDKKYGSFLQRASYSIYSQWR